MKKESKVISGLKKEKIVFLKTNKEFTETEKHQIIEEFLHSNLTKRDIWEKYTGDVTEHGQLLSWMRQLGYAVPEKRKRPYLLAKKRMCTKNNKPSTDAIATDFETLQLKKRIAELESQLKDAEMKAIAYSTMVDIAEKEMHISIRKKYNTKPLKQ